MTDDPVVSSAVVARLAAAAAHEVPGVLGLHGGALGEVATYGDVAPVRGVRVERTPAPRVRLRTVMRFGDRLDEVADEVRRRVRTTLAEQVPPFADAVVDVHVADVRATPDEAPPALTDTSGPGVHALP
ncbi:MAG TPA: Asp23/Gls24 family envelope stress response protein [Egibacteraceae bacterium]|nr:Asp23/Gls24 family envelope stress response protein [Egibacteraceae bacterium]